MFTFTFTVADQPLFAHRGPGEWLYDLLRIAGHDVSRVGLENEVSEDLSTWLVTVTGTEDVLRFAAVALNLHAEQTPWDSTPVEQGAALERVIAGDDPDDVPPCSVEGCDNSRTTHGSTCLTHL